MTYVSNGTALQISQRAYFTHKKQDSYFTSILRPFFIYIPRSGVTTGCPDKL